MGPVSSNAAPAQAQRARSSALVNHPAVLLAAICASVFVVYIGTAWFNFVYDDVYQVLDPVAINSRRHFLQYFTQPDFYTPYYRPFFTAWFRINDVLFGANPAGWHLSNVAAHVGVTALVYALVRRLAGTAPVALAAALIFGVHPIHIESVAWVSGACDVLCAIFVLAAFLAFLKGEEAQDVRWKMAAVALYAGSLLSKEAGALFPLIVAAHVVIFEEATWKKRITHAVRSATPFLLATAGYLAVSQAVTKLLTRAPDVSVGTALLTSPSVVWFYLKKLALPVGLSEFYDPLYVRRPTLAGFYLPLLPIALVACAIWLWQRRSQWSRIIMFAACWLVLTLAPVINVRNFRDDDVVHDRFLYLASVAAAILIAVGLQELSEHVTAAHRKWSLPAMSVGLGIVLAAINVPQQMYWASDYLLYRRGLEIAPHNDKARNNLGRLLAERGDFSTAETMFLEILRRKPDSGLAHYNLGYTRYRQGHYTDAETHLSRAVALLPQDPAPHLYLGLTEMRLSKLDAGEREVRQAIRLSPERVGYHLALGYVLELKGDVRGALEETRAERAYSPNNPAVRQRVTWLEAKVSESPPANQH